jgi:hypothetical protein
VRRVQQPFTKRREFSISVYVMINLMMSIYFAGTNFFAFGEVFEFRI